MNRAAGAMLLVLAPAAAAFAADGPADPWRGVYAGVHLGGGRAESRWRTDATITGGDTVEHDAGAAVSGLQLGYRFRVSPDWIVGVEGAYSWARFRTFEQSTELAGLGSNGRFRETDFRSLSAITAQAGYAQHGWLAYGKAGVAGSYVYLSTLNANNGVSSSTAEQARGWTAGVGVEFMLEDRWSFGIGYDHYAVRLDDRTVVQSNGARATYSGFTGRINAFVARLNRAF